MAGFESVPSAKEKKDNEPNEGRRNFLKGLSGAAIGGLLAGKGAIYFSEMRIAQKLSCKGFTLVPAQEMSIIDEVEKRFSGATLELMFTHVGDTGEGEGIMEALVKLPDGSGRRGLARGSVHTMSLEEMAKAAIADAFQEK